MDAAKAIDLARQAVVLTLIVGAPVLLVGLLVAAIVGVLQAATQVQDQTLSFAPKVLAGSEEGRIGPGSEPPG